VSGVIDAVVLSNRSRVLLRTIVAVWDATSDGPDCPGEPVTFLRSERGIQSAWPREVPPPTRDELTPLRLQGLVTASAPASEMLCVAPTPLGRVASDRLAPAAGGGVDPRRGAGGLAARVEALIEAHGDVDERVRLRNAWAAVRPTVVRAADAESSAAGRGPIAALGRRRAPRPERG
jgi:hypothetical protein